MSARERELRASAAHEGEPSRGRPSSARQALAAHWPEYLMEAAGLGLFMVSASGFACLLEAHGSPVRQALADPLLRRVLMGVAMGLTAVGLIYSPWGKQSGAHINPAVTLTFFRLGKVPGWDAAFYALAQFLGATAGMTLAAVVLGSTLAQPTVGFVATVPGPDGAAIAFAAEVLISFLLMSTVLVVSNHPRWGRYTGLVAGTLVALYISIEAPLSGMSMNPARTFGSAAIGNRWDAFWIYLVAPVLGMLAAAEFHVRLRGISTILCAKLHHQNPKRCIFCEAAS